MASNSLMGLRRGKTFHHKINYIYKSCLFSPPAFLCFFIFFTVTLFHSLLKFMTTLYDISWAFTVYHLLQLTLNAMSHKRQSSSHFTKGEKSYVKPPVAEGFSHAVLQGGPRCSWGVFSGLVGLSLVFLFRCG